MAKKNILYFMPDSPVKNDAGNKTRTLQLLEYFSNRGEQAETDFVIERYWSQWEEPQREKFENAFPQINLIVLNRKLPKGNKLKYFLGYKLPNYIKSHKWLIQKPALPNHNTTILQKSFNNLLRKKKYDFIIISYASWASLVKNNSNLEGAYLINDTHDFITGQIKDKKRVRLGEAFEKEVELLSLFDEVWSVSSDEMYLYSQFVKATHRFVPLMFQSKTKQNLIPFNQKKFDLIFVGSENPHNIKSIQWFFEKVYPILSASIRICIVGKVCNHIPSFQNVEKISFADTLDDYYYQSKISICPMLSGTGVKVKVIEAFSFGLPVVCTLRGLDGLPMKAFNGCLLGNDAFEFAKHINDLLTNEALYLETKTQGVKMFDSYFEKQKGYDLLNQIFEF